MSPRVKSSNYCKSESLTPKIGLACRTNLVLQNVTASQGARCSSGENRPGELADFRQNTTFHHFSSFLDSFWSYFLVWVFWWFFWGWFFVWCCLLGGCFFVRFVYRNSQVHLFLFLGPMIVFFCCKPRLHLVMVLIQCCQHNNMLFETGVHEHHLKRLNVMEKWPLIGDSPCTFEDRTSNPVSDKHCTHRQRS